MKKYPEFHDGRLDGLILEETCVHIFLTTYDKTHFVLEATEVVSLDAGTFKAGNIIFDVTVLMGEELTLDHMRSVHGPLSKYRGADEAQKYLVKAQRDQLLLLDINSSYGASCLVLAQKIELHKREKWVELHTWK